MNDFAVEIVSGNTLSNSYIDFSTPGVDFYGRIIYDHSFKQLSLINNGNDMTFGSTGNLNVPALTFTNASITNLTSSNLNVTNATITNTNFTNSSYVYLAATNASFANLYVDTLTSGYTTSIILNNTVDNTQCSLVINQHSFNVFGTFTNPASIFISPDSITRGSSIALSDNVNQTGSIFSMENSLKNGLGGAQGNGLNFVSNVFGGSILTLTTSGNVGINNTNPSSAATLDVTGAVYCTSISTGSLYASAINVSTISAGSATFTSINTPSLECTGITVTNLTVPGGSIFNSLYSTDLTCYTSLATDSSIITAMITTGNVRTANITTGNILTANITQANIILGVINMVSTGNLHVNGNLGINNVSGACKINVTHTSTKNTVLLENTNASGGSFIQLKNNYGFSWRAGICGGSVASAGNCFLINSNDFSGSNSKIQMFPSGQIQIGYEDLTVTPNTILVIGDIFSIFMTFHYAGSQVGEIFRNSVNGTTYGVKSDYRRKQNVKPVENALVKLMSLPVVNLGLGLDS